MENKTHPYFSNFIRTTTLIQGRASETCRSTIPSQIECLEKKQRKQLTSVFLINDLFMLIHQRPRIGKLW